MPIYETVPRDTNAVEERRSSLAHLRRAKDLSHGWISEATFEEIHKSCGPDWHAMAIHVYRARWDGAKFVPESACLEDEVKANRALSLPTIHLYGNANCVNPPSPPSKFMGACTAIRFDGVGHSLQRETPVATAHVCAEHFTGGDAFDFPFPQSRT